MVEFIEKEPWTDQAPSLERPTPRFSWRKTALSILLSTAFSRPPATAFTPGIRNPS